MTATITPSPEAATAAPSTSALPTLRERIDTMPPGWRGLYEIMWWARAHGMCSSGLRLRSFLCSLYNGSAARGVDLSDVQCLDRERREWLCDVLLHLADGTSNLWDSDIRNAAKACGVEAWFDAGFPKRRAAAEEDAP